MASWRPHHGGRDPRVYAREGMEKVTKENPDLEHRWLYHFVVYLAGAPTDSPPVLVWITGCGGSHALP